MAAKQTSKGKLVVITGGSRGIGLATAQLFARQNYRVVITGRDQQRLKSAEARLRKDGAEVKGLICDVTDPVSIEKLFASIKASYSNVDVLVNNAGVAHELAPADQLSLETWQQVIATNLTGMFLCTRAALPLMRAGGTIVNNLSVAAEQPFAGMSAYNASKFGAMGFTQALREDLRKREIRVVAVLPGATDTEIWNQFWADAPREKMLSAETVAQAIVHACSAPANATIEEIRINPTSGVL